MTGWRPGDDDDATVRRRRYDGAMTNPSQAATIAFATASFGQGVAVTPIQMINAFAAIANGELDHWERFDKSQLNEQVAQNVFIAIGIITMAEHV